MIMSIQILSHPVLLRARPGMKMVPEECYQGPDDADPDQFVYSFIVMNMIKILYYNKS